MWPFMLLISSRLAALCGCDGKSLKAGPWTPKFLAIQLLQTRSSTPKNLQYRGYSIIIRSAPRCFAVCAMVSPMSSILFGDTMVPHIE